MAKGISISLAAKCQLLFGLAVLVIIAGALAVPWQRMEQLAGQTNVKGARMVADLAFRQLHASSSPPATAASRPAASTGTTTKPSWSEIGLLDLPTYRSPRIVTLPSPGADLPQQDALTQEALAKFRTQDKEPEFGRVVTRPDKSRVYEYAAAVRLQKSCLACHAQWADWARIPLAESEGSGASPEPSSTASGGTSASRRPGAWP